VLSRALPKTIANLCQDSRCHARSPGSSTVPNPKTPDQCLQAVLVATQMDLSCNITRDRVVPRRERDDEVGDHEEHALQPMALAVLDHVVDNDDSLRESASA